MKTPELSTLSNEDLQKTLQEMKEDSNHYRMNGMVRKIAKDLCLPDYNLFMADIIIYQEAAKRWLESQTPKSEQTSEQWFQKYLEGVTKKGNYFFAGNRLVMEQDDTNSILWCEIEYSDIVPVIQNMVEKHFSCKVGTPQPFRNRIKR